MFAVFGMTKEYATKSADKNVKRFKEGKMIPIDEYESKCIEYVEKMMRSKKVVRVSPVLSTPEIARQWLDLSNRYDGVRLEVRINHPYKEVIKKAGGSDIKRKWSLFVEGNDYSLKGKNSRHT